MHPTILATFFEISRTVVGMCSAGIALFLIGVWTAKNEIAEARGLDKIVALSNLCFAIPLAVFGALHLFGPRFVIEIVPVYMPWAFVLGLFHRLRVDGRVLEHRHQNRGTLVRPAVRNHDVAVCRDDPFSWGAAPSGR